jgi:hypothetical protein
LRETKEYYYTKVDYPIIDLVQFDKHFNLILIEELFRMVAKGYEPYIKYKYATNEDSMKKISDLTRNDFSEFSRLINVEKKRPGTIKSLTIFSKPNDLALASVDFFDHEFMLYMGAKMKRNIEIKHGLKFVSEKQHHSDRMNSY